MALVRSRKVDIVVVTKLDRFARSLKHLVGMLEEFKDLNSRFVSLNDQIDMTTASGRLMLHIIAAFAEFELALVRERTMAGLAYARSQGKKLGRPPLHDRQAILSLRSGGMSYREIARTLNCSVSSVTDALRAGVRKTSV